MPRAGSATNPFEDSKKQETSVGEEISRVVPPELLDGSDIDSSLDEVLRNLKMSQNSIVTVDEEKKSEDK